MVVVLSDATVCARQQASLRAAEVVAGPCWQRRRDFGAGKTANNRQRLRGGTTSGAGGRVTEHGARGLLLRATAPVSKQNSVFAQRAMLKKLGK